MTKQPRPDVFGTISIGVPAPDFHGEQLRGSDRGLEFFLSRLIMMEGKSEKSNCRFDPTIVGGNGRVFR